MRTFVSAAAAVDKYDRTPCRARHRESCGCERHELLGAGRIDAVGPTVGVASAGGIDPRHGGLETVGPARGHHAGFVISDVRLPGVPDDGCGVVSAELIAQARAEHDTEYSCGYQSDDSRPHNTTPQQCPTVLE